MNSHQYRLATQLVELIHAHQGYHPGYRAIHAQGRYYAGQFTAMPEARHISRADHFQGQPVPVTVRHSNSPSANPFGPSDSVSMATRFYLPDGRVTDLIALPITLSSHGRRKRHLNRSRPPYQILRPASPIWCGWGSSSPGGRGSRMQ
jgi:hypothetical protein